ncbi:hypothetical protein BJ170DRAFT_714471 [Xylariales sp. AK1849]|nr:hypothetical protein BJ170DRAFT_714471 [Xylariales sp. AK1849]
MSDQRDQLSHLAQMRRRHVMRLIAEGNHKYQSKTEIGGLMERARAQVHEFFLDNNVSANISVEYYHWRIDLASFRRLFSREDAAFPYIGEGGRGPEAHVEPYSLEWKSAYNKYHSIIEEATQAPSTALVQRATPAPAALVEQATTAPTAPVQQATTAPAVLVQQATTAPIAPVQQATTAAAALVQQPATAPPSEASEPGSPSEGSLQPLESLELPGNTEIAEMAEVSEPPEVVLSGISNLSLGDTPPPRAVEMPLAPQTTSIDKLNPEPEPEAEPEPAPKITVALPQRRLLMPPSTPQPAPPRPAPPKPDVKPPGEVAEDRQPAPKKSEKFYVTPPKRRDELWD